YETLGFTSCTKPWPKETPERTFGIQAEVSLWTRFLALVCSRMCRKSATVNPSGAAAKRNSSTLCVFPFILVAEATAYFPFPPTAIGGAIATSGWLSLLGCQTPPRRLQYVQPSRRVSRENEVVSLNVSLFGPLLRRSEPWLHLASEFSVLN